MVWVINMVDIKAWLTTPNKKHGEKLIIQSTVEGVGSRLMPFELYDMITDLVEPLGFGSFDSAGLDTYTHTKWYKTKHPNGDVIVLKLGMFYGQARLYYCKGKDDLT